MMDEGELVPDVDEGTKVKITKEVSVRPTICSCKGHIQDGARPKTFKKSCIAELAHRRVSPRMM